MMHRLNERDIKPFLTSSSFFFFFCQYIFYKDGQIANRS